MAGMPLIMDAPSHPVNIPDVVYGKIWVTPKTIFFKVVQHEAAPSFWLSKCLQVSLPTFPVAGASQWMSRPALKTTEVTMTSQLPFYRYTAQSPFHGVLTHIQNCWELTYGLFVFHIPGPNLFIGGISDVTELKLQSRQTYICIPFRLPLFIVWGELQIVQRTLYISELLRYLEPHNNLNV